MLIIQNHEKKKSNKQGAKKVGYEQNVTSDEHKLPSNKQKVTSNEQKVTSNEQKLTSN